MAPLPPRALTAPPGWLTGMGGAARPWVRLLEETDGGGPGMGWFLAAASPAALVQRLALGCS